MSPWSCGVPTPLLHSQGLCPSAQLHHKPSQLHPRALTAPPGHRGDGPILSRAITCGKCCPHSTGSVTAHKLCTGGTPSVPAGQPGPGREESNQMEEGAPGEDWRQAQHKDTAAHSIPGPSQEISSIPGTATGPAAGRAPPHNPPEAAAPKPSPAKLLIFVTGLAAGSSLDPPLLGVHGRNAAARLLVLAVRSRFCCYITREWRCIHFTHSSPFSPLAQNGLKKNKSPHKN